MIELENLNNRSLEEILDEAKKQILYLSSEWTDFQEPDPGMTLVELFSWLKFVQHEYLNRMSPGVQMKFLNLLDVAMLKNCGSETFLEVSGLERSVTVPARTPWKSGDMIFENICSQTLIDSHILSVSFENPEFSSQEEYYKFGNNKAFYLFGKDIDRKNDRDQIRRFGISFDSPIPPETAVNLYFSVYVSRGLERNPILPSDDFEPMAHVEWEYYGAKEGEFGWHKIEILKDFTYNFLFSGVIKMKTDGIMQPVEGEYKIRATLVYDEYDYPPRIDNILTNVFKVCQNHTVCENTIIKKKDIEPDHTFKIFNHMAIYGRSHVYYKKSGGWVKTDLPTFRSNMAEGTLEVDITDVWNKIKGFGSEDEVIMVVSFEQGFENKMTLGSGSGTSGQIVTIDVSDILEDDFEIMISENVDGEEVFYKWSIASDLFSLNKYDKKYIMSKDGGFLAFGNHEHGMAPRVGVDNIKICSLRYTFAGDSNTKEGRISAVASRNRILQKARVAQILPACGGKDSETSEQAMARAADIFANPGRAVTKKDYEKIILRTPGLMFTNVKILPGYMPGEDASAQNCITVAVRWNRKVGLALPKSFEKNIMNQINKYRLINTKVKVVSPVYIGLVISGEIVVNSFYRESDELIENEIKEFITNTNSDLGAVLHFGDLFGMIDRLKYVSYLNKLRIIPIGIGAQKNASEDVVIPPNGVYYIQKIEFNYIRSSEIYRS